MADMLTTKQAAEILEIQPIAVIRAIARDRLKAVKFGTQWAIALEEVERYARERRIKPKKKEEPKKPVSETINELFGDVDQTDE